MRLPLIFLLIAIGAAAVVAYGTDPQWGQFAHGLAWILRARRLQGPLCALCMISCIVAIGLVISGKRRAWWLVGLGPVLALFVHRFVTDPAHHFAVIDSPPLVDASAADFLRDDDYVVGVSLAGTDIAYPYAALYSSPVILQPVHDLRCLVIWSPYANRALAFTVDHEIQARELEVVCMPANALLLYNRRSGQFINGITGQTPAGTRPGGFLNQLQIQKMPWARWKALHPETRVSALAAGAPGPAAPLMPRYAMPPAATTRPIPEHVALIAATQPVAVDADAVTADAGNISGPTNLLIFRDPVSGEVRAFDRRCNGDLFPQFVRKTDPKRPAVAFVDRDSGSEWTADGHAIFGPLLKEHLRPILVEDDVDGSVVANWYPELDVATPVTVLAPESAGTKPPAPALPHRRKRQPQ